MPLSRSRRRVRFATTRWSLVVAAGEEQKPGSHAALAELCERYWPPLYAFLRQQGYEANDASDLTQSFILELLNKSPWSVADPQKGRFRTFLLGCLKHFLSHEREKKQAKKRGGSKITFSMQQADGESAYRAVSREPLPEKLFEQAWMNAILKRVVDRFLEPYPTSAEQKQITQLLPSVLGSGLDYAHLAAQHQKTPAAMRQWISRLRKKYQELLLEEIGDTVMEPADVQNEIQYLFALASRK